MTDLESFRTRIDDCDDRLVALLAERLAVCDEVAEWKALTRLPIMQPVRVDEVKKRCAQRGAARGLRPGFVRQLYDVIIDEACRREAEEIDRRRATR